MRSEWRVTNGESTKLRDTSAVELAKNKKTGRGGVVIPKWWNSLIWKQGFKVRTLHEWLFSHSWCGQGNCPKKAHVFCDPTISNLKRSTKKNTKKNHQLFHVVFQKSKLGKRSKSPRNLIKPMEALVRNLPSLNLHMRCIPLFLPSTSAYSSQAASISQTFDLIH